ncbi:MAG: hypothetical protein AB2551_12665 [Candidatus Thiodiazotropha sp.]
MTHRASSREHANRLKRLKKLVIVELKGIVYAGRAGSTATACRKTASFAVDSLNWIGRKGLARKW